MTTAVRRAVIALLAVHGLIHLLGAAEGFGWAEVAALEEPIGTIAALVWMLASALVLATAAMIAIRRPTWWWALGAAAVIVSQAVILTSWTDAKAGTVANVLLALVCVHGFAARGPTSFATEWDPAARPPSRPPRHRTGS